MIEAVTSPDSDAFAAAKQAQAEAANPMQSSWVEANAGSGKTKVLIDRVARLLLPRNGQPGARPDSILCITYTKAAANEMLSRLYARLGKWAVATDQQLRESLSELEGRPQSSYTEEDFLEARRLFARALETPGGLRIETIHALCARILRRFPLEAGIAPGFKAIEEDEANALWRGVLQVGLENLPALKPDEMQGLVDATGGLGLSAAVDALKFKRHELSHFYRNESSEKEWIERIRSAADASTDLRPEFLASAMGSEFPSEPVRAVLADLNAIADPGKADIKLRDALADVLQSGDPVQKYALYMSAIAGAKADFPAGSNPYTSKASALTADLFSRNLKSGTPEGREITRMKAVQTGLKAIDLRDRSVALMKIGLPIITAYTREKAQRGALDFDDLIAKTYSLLTQSNAAEWVLYKLDGGISHLLLDEAQDTSPPQWSLINAIVSEFQSGMGQERATAPRTQFVVGDPKQSIYSFQGAYQHKFETERQDFLRREEVIATSENRKINLPRMAMSFRSTPEVLQFVDEVRAHVPLDKSATDPLPPPDADITPHAPRRANQSGRVELWPLERPDVVADEDHAWTTPVDHVPADAPRRRLARSIAQSVRQMIDAGETVWKEQSDGRWQREPVQPEDILIQVRSRNELFEALIESLKQESIPVAGADRLRLLDNLGVQDCLNLIRFALQPEDDLALAEILRGPFCGLVDDDRHLFALAHGRGRGVTLWDRLRQAPADTFGPAKAFCEGLLAHRDQPVFEFLTRALTDRGADGLSGWDRLIQRLGEPVRDPVNALVSAALGHDMTQARSLQNFLCEIEQQNTVLKRELGEPDGAVRVMTVHGAKGLQSPVVILPDTTSATKLVSDALFIDREGVPLYSPSARTDAKATTHLREAANAAAEQESRRLLYVALTRASDRLIIAGAGLGNAKLGYAKSSWYRWCLTAMRALVGEAQSDDLPEEILSLGPPVPTATATPKSKPSDTPCPDWLTQPAPAPLPPQRLAAPSRLTEDQASVSPPFGATRSAALRRGRHIHALLQTQPALPASDHRTFGQRFLSRDTELTPSEIEEMLEVTLRTLAHPDFATVFDRDGRSEAAIVGTLPNSVMVNGRVDRLIIRPDEILIIDYKTDRPAPRQASDVDLSYRVQMAAYRAVLMSLYPDRPVRCGLLYTDGPHLITLDAVDMSESLNRVESGV